MLLIRYNFDKWATVVIVRLRKSSVVVRFEEKNLDHHTWEGGGERGIQYTLLKRTTRAEIIVYCDWDFENEKETNSFGNGVRTAFLFLRITCSGHPVRRNYDNCISPGYAGGTDRKRTGARSTAAVAADR